MGMPEFLSVGCVVAIITYKQGQFRLSWTFGGGQIWRDYVFGSSVSLICKTGQCLNKFPTLSSELKICQCFPNILRLDSACEELEVNSH